MKHASPTKLLLMLLVLLIGLLLWQFVVAFVMDVFSIVVYELTGWHLGLEFIQKSLDLWPGGEIIGAVMFNDQLTIATILIDLFEVLLVATIRFWLPPIRYGGDGFQLGRLLRIGMLDAAITSAIAIFVSYLFALGLGDVFTSFAVPAVQTMFAIATLGLALTATAVATKKVRGGDVKFAFNFITAVGRWGLVTLALITWSSNGIAGALMVVLCVLACGLLTMVDGRESGLW